MKKILLLCITVLLCSGCNISEDCIKSSGTIITKEIDIPDGIAFNTIYVNAGISLVLTQGAVHTIAIEAGDNFINDIDASISGNMLRLTDNSGCNWVRDYGNVTVHVTSPDIIEIYSNTGKPIRSNGVLTYSILRLYAMDFFGGVGTNDFFIAVDNNQLVIESSNVAGFYITGKTNQMVLSFYDGVGRFEGPDFLAKSIKVFQRGSNDMIIHPVDSLQGDIYSTGHVRSRTHPAYVDVQEHYSGQLIFEN